MSHPRYFSFPYSVPNGMMNSGVNNNDYYNMNQNYVNGYSNMNNYQNPLRNYNYNNNFFGRNSNGSNIQNNPNNQIYPNNINSQIYQGNISNSNNQNNQIYRGNINSQNNQIYQGNISNSNSQNNQIYQGNISNSKNQNNQIYQGNISNLNNQNNQIYQGNINNSNNLYNQNNIYYRGENGLENGLPNSQRQRNTQIFNNPNNNINYNISQSQNQNINPNQINYINGNNVQNIENGNQQNGANANIENGKPEEKKEKVKTYAELNLDYENDLRKQIEKTTPLISEDFDIKILIDEYNSNQEYLNSIINITKKYKYIRKVRRDGNCFYRSFIFRLFEHICIKNDRILFEKIKQKLLDSKDLIQRNGYDWVAVEDFYNLFLREFTNCFNSLTYESTVRDYLDTLFCEREKGNYLIYFIRFCIAAYIKEQKDTYQMYIEGPIDEWIGKEVEAIDHEADQVQIMACVNYFDIGVKIEYLNKNQSEIVKLPYDKPDEQFFIFLLFTPGHYDLLYP